MQENQEEMVKEETVVLATVRKSYLAQLSRVKFATGTYTILGWADVPGLFFGCLNGAAILKDESSPEIRIVYDDVWDVAAVHFNERQVTNALELIDRFKSEVRQIFAR